MTFEGTLTALVTPFRSDGSLDLAALAELVEWQIQEGIDGLVPCGSTGEAATLTPSEHVDVVHHVVEVAAGRVPVVAGTGSNSTREAIEFTQHARRAGADGALLISPYYNKPTQEGIFLHYRAVAQEADLPLVIYNIPGRTASRIEPPTAARLARVPQVVGLKEAGADLVKTAETIHQAGPELSVLSGDDALTLPIIALGGRGVISTSSNVAPAAVAALTRAARAGDFEAARRAHYALLPLMQTLFVESNPIPLKAALQICGRIPDATLRLPLTPVSKANHDLLEQVLQQSGLTSR